MSESVSPFERHLKINQADLTAVEHLSSACDLSRNKLKQAMQKGAVWLTQQGHTRRIRRASKQLLSGDHLHLYYDEKILTEIPAVPKLIADEDVYSIWYKPYGMRSQGSKWGDHCTINRWVELNFNPQRPAFIVHRLDRAATGLIILAHSHHAAAAFGKLFSQRKINKYYKAIVHGHYPEQTEAVKLDSMLDDRPAVSYVQCVAYDENHNRSMLRVKIETGRKHQIRRHLSNAGFPILGDRLYGVAGDDCDLQLTACELEFFCPISGSLKHYLLNQDECVSIKI
ncbi:MAG: RNA pseudouridine synthase [Gammaproteobacteria bacterium]|nr:RNA pseudouridine synthase [Gammaproteobacteria bacterium]